MKKNIKKINLIFYFIIIIISCQNSNEHNFVYNNFYVIKNQSSGNNSDVAEDEGLKTMCDFVCNTTSIAIAKFDNEINILPSHCSDDSTKKIQRKMYAIDTLAGPRIPDEVTLEHYDYFPNFKSEDLFLVKVYIIDYKYYFAGIAPISVSSESKDTIINDTLPSNTKEFSSIANSLLNSNLNDACPDNQIMTPEELYFYYIGYWSRPCPPEEDVNDVIPPDCGNDDSQCKN